MKKTIIDKKLGVPFEIDTTIVTFECDPKEMVIGLDEKLRVGNFLYIPGEYCDSDIPEHMAIIGVENKVSFLYRVAMARLSLVKPIPVGTELIIAKNVLKL